jgi:pimeloyl-ACP methyl ester carboxylesterase
MKALLISLGVIIGILILLAVVLPLIIPIPKLVTKHASALADQDSQFMDINGIQVHYKQTGDGSPDIILLHGFGASVFSWKEVMEPLSSLGTVYAYDRPGFGFTERPLLSDWQGENPYSLSGQVKMLQDFMDQKGIERAVLVGNSAGGTVATQFALEHPERVVSLVEVDAALVGSDSSGLSSWQKQLLNTPQAERLGPLLMRSICKWGTELIRTAWHEPAKITPGVVEGYQKPLQADGWDMALFEIFKAREAQDLTSRLKDINLPVLVITGDDDRIIPTADSIRLASMIPGAELAVLADCGHVPQEECPQEFLKILIPFIQKSIQ